MRYNNRNNRLRIREIHSTSLRVYEPFALVPGGITYRIVDANRTHFFYVKYDRDLRIEGSRVFSTPHRRVLSLWRNWK
ncbi:hypothetical protein SAMN04488132_1175 [Sediminibacterium ginsengisoli]|uniref:Uncharacterized protein n=1 Tax=Sediminibacterium ginsengisoli TaxID=413434 RepID=A0A1T4RYY6_9BACT|nr:hypothetical protein SAMN04488132_1175 [Sediminibacterium ginsengisoli]